jgi:hypothetical protein
MLFFFKCIAMKRTGTGQLALIKRQAYRERPSSLRYDAVGWGLHRMLSRLFPACDFLFADVLFFQGGVDGGTSQW